MYYKSDSYEHFNSSEAKLYICVGKKRLRFGIFTFPGAFMKTALSDLFTNCQRSFWMNQLIQFTKQDQFCEPNQLNHQRFFFNEWINQSINPVNKTRPVLFDSVMIFLDSVKIHMTLITLIIYNTFMGLLLLFAWFLYFFEALNVTISLPQRQTV